MKTPYLIEAPVHLERAIQEIQVLLADRLPWLALSYGRATRNATKQDGRTLYYPEIFTQQGIEYKNLMPNDMVEAQSFFKVDDPGTVVDGFRHLGLSNTYSYRVSLIFWFDTQRIGKTAEQLKYEAIQALGFAPAFLLERIFETVPQVWKDYTYTEHLESRSFRQPFGGFRLEGVLQFNESMPC